MGPQQISAGQIYGNVDMPRRQWRVVGIRNESVKLERTDKPNVIRFVPATELHDKRRYVLAETSGRSE